MTYTERIEKLENGLRRLRKIVCCQMEAGTPIGANDPVRPQGTMMYDDNFIYIMTSVGWKKATLAAL